jgi:protein toll
MYLFFYLFHRRVFQNLPRLRELYLNDNRLRYIHQNAFTATRSIETLQLENNRLSFALDEIEITLDQIHQYNTPFQYLGELRRLILRNNSITKIYSDWCMVNLQLEELDLSFNNITKVRDLDLQFLSTEIKLNLSNNHIVEVDFSGLELMVMAQESLDKASKVHVSFQSNPIVCNCLLLGFVKYLQNEMVASVKKVFDISVDGILCAGRNTLTGRALTTVHKDELLCPFDSPNSAIQKCPRQCKCSVRIADLTLIVNCSNANLTEVPELPENTSLSSLELYIQNNSITHLPLIGSPGYANVTKIFAQNNNISLLLKDNLPLKLHTLNLTNNQLNFVNTSVLEGLNHTKQLALSHNPWLCNCGSLDLVTFVQSRFQLIPDYENIQCSGSSSKLASMSPGALCPEEQTKLIILCVVLTIFVLIISAMAILYYKYEQEIKIWMYAHDLCLWCVSEEELDKDKKYDAFISYSHKDEEFAKQLIDNLESGPNPLKLCFHDRDWIPGESIQNQVIRN